MTDTIGNGWLWSGFLALVAGLLALDLGVFHRRDHAVGPREALGWSAFWVALALAFGAAVWGLFGPERGEEYLVAYVIEKSLSVDNLFVFVAVFGALRVPAEHQHRVLFWGIVSAVALRAAMIFGGVALLTRFHFLMYVFGAVLVLGAVKLYRHRRDAGAGAGALALASRLIPSTDRYHGRAFLAREGGRWLATPLLLALVAIELTDVVFAVDSIPAVLAVTRDPFIVFTSNIFALLGLRSLYFLLAGAVDRFLHLRVGLAAILAFVGAKMLLLDVVKLPAVVSLAVVTALLGGSILTSLLAERRARRRAHAHARAAGASAERAAG